MKFYLEDGGYTEILFYKDDQGSTQPFPMKNTEIVRSQGTEESKDKLEKILMDGVTALRDRVYIAFMGPPILSYKVRCYCGRARAGEQALRLGYYAHCSWTPYSTLICSAIAGAIYWFGLRRG